MADGLITRSQAQRILEQYDVDAPVDGYVDTDWTRSILYAVAAVLLGAAAIAFILVGIEPEQGETWLFGVGLALAAAGTGAHVLFDDRPLLADALLAAALAPVAAAVVWTNESSTALLLGGAGVGLGLVYLATRHKASFLPSLTVIGVSVTMAAAAFTGTWIPDETASFLWALGQGGLGLIVLLLDRYRRAHPHAPPTGLAVAGLAVSLFPFFSETVGLERFESVQLAAGGIMVAILAAGVYLADRGLVGGAGVSLGVIAIMFAFTVGGIWLGAGLLVALAALIIWQAENVNAWLRS